MYVMEMKINTKPESGVIAIIKVNWPNTENTIFNIYIKKGAVGIFICDHWKPISNTTSTIHYEIELSYDKLYTANFKFVSKAPSFEKTKPDHWPYPWERLDSVSKDVIPASNP